MTNEKKSARNRILVAGTRLIRERYRIERAEEERSQRHKKRQYNESLIAESCIAAAKHGGTIREGFMEFSMVRVTKLPCEMIGKEIR